MTTTTSSGNFIAGRNISLRFSSSLTVDLYVDMAVGIGGDKWPAADQFCHFIATEHAYFRNLFEGKSVIELGSGTGLVCILIEKLGLNASEILVTDQESHIQHIHHNLSLNGANRICVAGALDWFCLEDRANKRKFDIVLAFECVYKEELYEPLINTLLEVSHNDSIIFLGLTRLFAKRQFFEKLLVAGLTYTLIPQEVLPREFQADTNMRDVGLFVLRRRRKFTSSSS